MLKTKILYILLLTHEIYSHIFLNIYYYNKLDNLFLNLNLKHKSLNQFSLSIRSFFFDMEKRGNYSILLNVLSYSNQVKMNNKFSKTRKQTEPHMTLSFTKTEMMSWVGSP